MKNFLAKLKAMDKKKAVVDHFEKGILGVVGLFVLVCLGGTSWSRYDKQPKEFQDKVEAGERNIQASAFTVEEQAKYKPLDIMGFVQTLQSPLEVSRFNYSTDWFWPMYPTAIKITEPKWLAPVEPIADFGKAVIVEIPQDQLQSSKVAVEVADAGSAKKPVATDDDDEFAIKRGANAPNTSGGSGVGAAAETADAINVAGAANAYKNLGGSGSGGSGASAMMNMMGPGSGMSTNTNMVNARGNRFVSVRAVFPLGDQIEELAKSMHEQRQKAADFVNFLDFEVERQVAMPGDKTWSGPWEKVDLQATLDLLDRIEFDTDLVDPAYTDNVFTMPLPQRVIGRWNKWASHPSIKTLTDEQAELQAQVNARLAEEAEKKKTEDKTSKRGFASRVHDARGMRTQAMGSGGMNSAVADINSMYKQGDMQTFNPNIGSEQMGSALSGFTEQLNRTGNGRMSKYLLFRYFDFQVTPGAAYRYRVRMTLLNPNFKRAVEELVDESIAAGETRVTPWSEPTPHVFIPDEQRMFLAKADKARPDTGLPSANIDVFQWFSEAGTTILAKVDKLQLGQFVGGTVKETEVYRPAGDTLNKEDVPVFTGSLLTDVAPSPVTAGFDFSEHADLKLDDKKLKQWTTADKALVVDRYGQLAMLDTKSASDERTVAESVVDKERAGVRARIKTRPTANSTGDFPGTEGSSGAADQYGMEMMMGAGGGNALRKGAKSAAKKPTKGKGRGNSSGSSSGGSSSGGSSSGGSSSGGSSSGM